MLYLFKIITNVWNYIYRLQSVLAVPMAITVSTTVVVSVWTTLHVTNRLVTVTGGVTRDILIMTVAKVNCLHIILYSEFSVKNSNVNCCRKKNNYFHYIVNCIFLFLVCLLGHYGTHCSERCSGHCINKEPCDHVGGVCPGGCEDGYTGKLCNNCTNLNRIFIRVSIAFRYATFNKLTHISSLSIVFEIIWNIICINFARLGFITLK